MAHEMIQFKATANAHMRRDMDAGGKWVCGCEACHGIRSLMGMDKMLDVRPLVRQIQQVEEKFQELPDGPQKRSLLEQYLKLHDKLADVVAKEL
jgi:hypothetical protein